MYSTKGNKTKKLLIGIIALTILAAGSLFLNKDSKPLITSSQAASSTQK